MEHLPLVIVLLDGIYHLFASEKLLTYAPDAQISKFANRLGFKDAKPLSTRAHRWMGVFLILGCLTVVFLPDNLLSDIFAHYVIPFVLFLLSIGIVLNVINT